MERIVSVMIGYAFGLLQTGYIYGKLHHMDIRRYGSGNAGTTNALRTLGWKAGLVTFLGDAFKCIFAVLAVKLLFGHSHGEILPVLAMYAGMGAVLGHNYPFYLGFKGGKGIAVTSAVVMSAAHPVMIPIGLAIFIAAVILTKYVSVGSLFVAWYIPANTLVFHHNDKAFVHMMVISLLFTVFAYFQHRQNIVRLIHGNENKLWQKKEEKEAASDEQS